MRESNKHNKYKIEPGWPAVPKKQKWFDKSSPNLNSEFRNISNGNQMKLKRGIMEFGLKIKKNAMWTSWYHLMYYNEV